MRRIIAFLCLLVALPDLVIHADLERLRTLFGHLDHLSGN